MPDIKMTVEGDRELVAKFTKYQMIAKSEKLNQALLDSAMVVERRAKENLQEMVYLQPEGFYSRTHFLFNKTMASGIVKVTFDELSTAVSSLIHYAKYVHFGTGRGKNAVPRPFLTKALLDAKEEVLSIFSKAIL